MSVDETTMCEALRRAGWVEVIPGVWRRPAGSWEVHATMLLATGEAYAALRGNTNVTHRVGRQRGKA